MDNRVLTREAHTTVVTLLYGGIKVSDNFFHFSVCEIQVNDFVLL